jgi:hypothetical protein
MNSPHGGTRPGSGRKVSAEPTASHHIRLTRAHWAAFQSLGGVKWLRVALDALSKPAPPP